MPSPRKKLRSMRRRRTASIPVSCPAGRQRRWRTKHPLRVGVGGPVGSGKTALMEQLCKRLKAQLSEDNCSRALVYKKAGHQNSNTA